MIIHVNCLLLDLCQLTVIISFKGSQLAGVWRPWMYLFPLTQTMYWVYSVLNCSTYVVQIFPGIFCEMISFNAKCHLRCSLEVGTTEHDARQSVFSKLYPAHERVRHHANCRLHLVGKVGTVLLTIRHPCLPSVPVLFVVYYSWVTWRHFVQFTLLQPKIVKKSLKPLFLGFRVNQGHQCRQSWKAGRQCLLW